MMADGGSGGEAGYASPAAGANGGAPQQTAVDITFDAGSELHIAPRRQRSIVVGVEPPAAYTVRLSLLGSDGEPHDGALDRGEVVTDADGRGGFVLTAPSAPMSLALRAEVGSASGTLPIAVTAVSTTTVRIKPLYAGRRTVTEWVASVHPNTICPELPGSFPPDGEFFSRILPDQNARFDGIPVNTDLAVVVRAEAFAVGCRTARASSSGEPLHVDVEVADRAMDLGATVLDVAFALAPDDAGFTAALEAGVTDLVNAFGAEHARDLSALLDAMERTLGAAQRVRFVAARSAANWDTALSATLGKEPVLLRSGIRRWVRIGSAALFSARAIEGRLSGGRGRAPEFNLDRLAELPAGALNATAEMLSWDADASDTLAFAGTLQFRASQLAAGLARAPAIAETGAADMASALSHVAACTELSNALLATDTPEARALDASCARACLASTCASALAQMWERSVEASDEVSLSIAAAGRSTVGPGSQAIAVEGDWIGKLSLVERELSSGGTVRGFAPKYAAR